MKYLITGLLLALALHSHSKIWLVDPNGTYKSPHAVRNLVADGDTIEIEAAIYKNHPQTYFYKNNLLIRGINGRPRLEGGATLAGNANGKAIFVVNGDDCHVHNIEFANASVPDLNGAGIRQEGCDLLITNCYFRGNEMGILGGNYSNCKVTIEYCVFTNNGNPKRPGFQHNVYINHIDTLLFQYNLTYDASAEGHELKSRARNNIIRYNYIANINSGDSRNIDLPNGGTSILLGNVIEQGENSVNSGLIGYGLEGLDNPAPHNIWLVNNTIINRKSKGNFVNVHTGTDTVTLRNNILVGAKTSGLVIGNPAKLDSSSNLVSNDVSAPKFGPLSGMKYMIDKQSPCLNKGASLSASPLGYSLVPTLQYSDTASHVARFKDQTIDIGAYEYKGGVGIERFNGTMVQRLNSSLVYPNPLNDGELRLLQSSQTVAPFEVYNASGQFVYGGVFLNGYSKLDLRPGLYWIKIEGSGVQKVLVGAGFNQK